MTFTEQLIIAAVLIVLPVIISLSALMYQHLIQRIPEKQRQIIQQVMNVVVSAVEQMAVKQGLSGPDKKQKALELAKLMLQELHINIPDAVLEASIEAAVYSLNQQQSKGTPATPPQLVAAGSVS